MFDVVSVKIENQDKTEMMECNINSILSVEQLMQKLMKEGLFENGDNHKLLHEKTGTLLEESDMLRICNVADGDVLRVVKDRKQKDDEKNNSAFDLWDWNYTGSGTPQKIKRQEIHEKEFNPELMLKNCDDGFKQNNDTLEKVLGKLIRYEDITAKKLYYNSKEESIVSELEEILTCEKTEKLRKKFEKKKIAKSINILFFGVPGTGKTESAKQIARKTKRDIYMVDMTAIETRFWHELFKNLKRIFRQHKELCKYYKENGFNEPILLLNECESIFGNRKTSDYQKEEHSQKTNILLNEMEEFEGIIIATTNIEGDMDEAFERRFLFKLRLDKPSIAIREKIFEEKFKGVYNGSLEHIAQNYELTGGEIDNVVRKAIIREVKTGQKNTEETIMQICDDEKINKDTHKKAGFEL